MKKETTKPAKPEHKGVMRNDLPGYMKVLGNRIYIRWKGKDISTGQKNTVLGWKKANEFWAKRSQELQAIEDGEKPIEDTIGNIFEKFLNYKRNIDKITDATKKAYIYAFKQVFLAPDEVLNEANIKRQIAEFAENTTLVAVSVNHYLRLVGAFLNWASDDDNNYIPAKKYIKKYKQKEASHKVKPAYTAEHYELLLEYFEQQNSSEICLLLQFLWNTGARCGEALSIKLPDLDLKNSRINIPNKMYKGESEALLLIPEAVKIVEQVQNMAIRRGDEKLFSWKSRTAPNKVVARAEKKLGAKIKERGLHGFRRAFADRLFEKGLDIPEVKDIMRHRNIETTMKYYRSYQQKKLIEKMSKRL